MVITIEGIIGAGKTTFGTALHNKIAHDGQSVTFVPEPTPTDNAWLMRYYEDQHRWAFHAQMSMLLLRLRAYKLATSVSDPNTVILMDRSVFSDKSFAYANFKMGFMSQDEYSLYQQAYTTLIEETKIDLVLHVESSLEDAMVAVKRRARTENEVNGVTEEYQLHLQDGLKRSLSECSAPLVRVARLPFGQGYSDQLHELSSLIRTRLEVERQDD